MNNNQIIKFPLGEVLKRSFYLVFVRGKDFFKAASFWYWLVLVEVLLGYPTLAEGLDIRANMIKVASALLVSIAGAGIGTEVCRGIIAKDNEFGLFKPAFNERSLRYWGYNLLIGLMFVLSLFVCLSILLPGGRYLPTAVLTILVLLFSFGIGAVCFRFYLVLPAQAINDKTMTLKHSWLLTKGNTLKLLAGIITISIPGVVLSVLLGNFSRMIPGFDESNLWRIVFTLLALSVSFLDAVLKASFLSHVYQYLTFYETSEPRPEA